MRALLFVVSIAFFVLSFMNLFFVQGALAELMNDPKMLITWALLFWLVADRFGSKKES